MISSLIKNEAAFAAASLTYTLERGLVVKYLPAMGMETFAIVIKKNMIEEMSWRTYFFPFTINVWYAVVLVSIIVFAAYEMVDLFLSMQTPLPMEKNMLVKIVGDYWMLLMCCLSKNFAVPGPNSKLFYRIFYFVMFFCGSVMFMCYRSSLTSELSVTREILPFTNLKEFVTSGYR